MSTAPLDSIEKYFRVHAKNKEVHCTAKYNSVAYISHTVLKSTGTEQYHSIARFKSQLCLEAQVKLTVGSR